MRPTAILIGLLLALPVVSAAPPDKTKHRNRLGKEASLYLLMHAHNPTDWYPWGAEAFAKARKENKLVLLSIGYSSCYWCHVMERESFNDPKTAQILNEHFVCIKVDREERPDIDNVYMTALQELGRGGGWPLTMFLLPDGRPIVGGTYFPPEDIKEKERVYPGFRSLLKIVHEAWKKEPEALKKQAENLAGATTRALNSALPGIALIELDRRLVDEVLGALKEEFDPEYGGWGSAARNFRGAKFPIPCRLDFFLQQGERRKDKKLVDQVALTLEKMARGGIYDQLGGGFHRYSTERTWTVPHFEKMLYDNGQLAQVLAKTYRLTKNSLFREVLEDTLAYVQREMMSPEGAFYSSQDAETHHEEGRFYVWTPKEWEEALPDAAERAFANRLFGIGAKPNFEGKYHILQRPLSWESLAEKEKTEVAAVRSRAEQVRKKLFEVRSRREKPLRNEMALTGWSGLMIAGFAEAGDALGEKKYLDTAARAAAFVLKQQVTPEGRLLRTYGAAPGSKARASGPAYLDDYAFLVHGLLTLHRATGEKQWLEASRRLTDAMIAQHGEERRGGYWYTAHDHEKLFARSKDQFDGATPSGNSMAAQNLVRLSRATGEERYRREAERTLKSFAGPLRLAPSTMAGMGVALDDFIEMGKEKSGK